MGGTSPREADSIREMNKQLQTEAKATDAKLQELAEYLGVYDEGYPGLENSEKLERIQDALRMREEELAMKFENQLLAGSNNALKDELGRIAEETDILRKRNAELEVNNRINRKRLTGIYRIWSSLLKRSLKKGKLIIKNSEIS